MKINRNKSPVSFIFKNLQLQPILLEVIEEVNNDFKDNPRSLISTKYKDTITEKEGNLVLDCLNLVLYDKITDTTLKVSPKEKELWIQGFGTFKFNLKQAKLIKKKNESTITV